MNYLDSIAGGGKTYAAIGYVAAKARQNLRYIVALPSKLMIKQSYKDIQDRFPGVKCAAIHGGTNPGHVLGAVIAKIKKVRSSGNAGFVLIVTHATLERLPDIFRKGWNVIVDEVPNVTNAFVHNDMANGVRKNLEALPMGPRYCRIVPNPSGLTMWKRIAAGKLDHTKDPANNHGIQLTLWKYKAFATALMNPHTEMFGLTEQWTPEALADPNLQITLFSLVNPSIIESGFNENPCIMSACLPDTLLYRMWEIRNGVKFEPQKAIASRVRNTEHTNGHLLTIYYATERNYSKKLRDRPAVEGVEECGTVQQHIAAAALKLFGDDPFAYMCNTDSEGIMVEKGKKLPNTPHGLNDFQDYHNCVVFSALNLRPAHIKFLSSFGISSDEIRCAISYQATYQAALRISLRNPANTDKKILVVQDKGCAEYVQKLFPGSTVKMLATGLTGIGVGRSKGRGRPKADQTSAKKVRDYREEKRMALEVGTSLLKSAEFVTPTSIPSIISPGYKNGANIIHPSDLPSDIASDPASDKPVGMSLFANKDASKPYAVYLWNGIDDFVEYLRELSEQTHTSKADNSPGLFNALNYSST